MERARVGGAAFVIMGALAGAVPVHAQATVGADLALFSSYVWRGLSLTNKPVAQPDLYITIPAGKASVTLGGWANIDLGKYDNANKDISESGGSSALNFAEFDPWAEIGYTVGKATLTGGATAYIYPNKNTAPLFALTSDFNTVEVYGKVAFAVPLNPKISVWYDVDKIKGAYIEGSVSHPVPLSEKVSLNLGALAGFSAGQGSNPDVNGVPQAEFFNFVDDGFAHADFSVGLPLTAGIFSITPVLHLHYCSDENTKITSPTNTSDAKLWGGVTISWSKTLGEVPEETTEGTQ
jgi:hypothetical protein